MKLKVKVNLKVWWISHCHFSEKISRGQKKNECSRVARGWYSGKTGNNIPSELCCSVRMDRIKSGSRLGWVPQVKGCSTDNATERCKYCLVVSICQMCLLHISGYDVLKQNKVSLTSGLFPVFAAEKRKCPGPALWRSWTMGWLDQREQITAISLWTSWACGPSFLFSWKPPRRWRKLVLQRKNMKVSH